MHGFYSVADSIFQEKGKAVWGFEQQCTRHQAGKGSGSAECVSMIRYNYIAVLTKFHSQMVATVQ